MDRQQRFLGSKCGAQLPQKKGHASTKTVYFIHTKDLLLASLACASEAFVVRALSNVVRLADNDFVALTINIR